MSCLSTHYATSHLLTASYDNTIVVVRMGLLAGGEDFVQAQVWDDSHGTPPYREVGLTAAKEKKLTWNLVIARAAFITNIKVGNRID